ncbi:methionyl-tRNA formyltransferase [Brevibacillus choshinensis]|uniref:Methionyl-tRNA formyltransferase n=1 Tax=Brevibacillus choshinensis TaxID=54911 RepID=A0ABR5ND87_BRECH|nr:SgcJ/EcaC family oxidoreductase [Brevibacillus choshinensis]KQL49519.1 methionyl-tRNA formyltransferase [Brevibacillus choshinensis]
MVGHAAVFSEDEKEVRSLYATLITGWNERSAKGMAAPFAPDGSLIGFDGSQVAGREGIEAHLLPIFASHPTPPYVTIVRSVRFIGSNAAILQAVAGMIPPGKTDIEPALHAIQTVVAEKCDGEWRVVLFQTTPAQFHGRPELVDELTEELRALL